MSNISVFWSKEKSPRRRVLGVLAVAAFLLAAVVGSLLVLEELKDRRERLGAEVIARVEQVELELMGFFGPLSTCLEIIGKWGVTGIIDPTLPDQLSRQIAPLLDLLPQVSSVEFDSPGSPSSFVVRTTDGWKGLRLGPGDSDLYMRLGRSADPGGSNQPEIGWHFPVPLLHEDTMGAIATTQWEEDGNSWLVGLNVTFNEIRKLAEALPTDDSAEIVWLTDQGDVIRLLDLSARAAGASGAQLLSSSRGTVAEVMTKLLLDESADAEQVQQFQFTHEDRSWWCAIYPSGVAGRFIRIGLAVPEKRLIGAVERERDTLGLVVAGLLAAGVLMILVLSLSSRRSVEDSVSGREAYGSPEVWLQNLVEKGETLQVEFKSSMRWNVQKDRPGKEVEFSWLKTVVAFLNTEGGTLVIGVDDEKNALGIEVDQFPNEDKYLLHFNNLIKEYVGLEYSSLLLFDRTPFDGRQVLVVQCRKSEDPVFLKKGNAEEFYVRVGPGSRKLTTRQVLEYLKTR